MKFFCENEAPIFFKFYETSANVIFSLENEDPFSDFEKTSKKVIFP